MTRPSRTTPGSPARDTVEVRPEARDELVGVEIRRDGDRPVVRVTGTLDASGAPLLEAVVEHVAERDGTPVLVDLSAVDLADSHGLAPALRRGVVLADASAPVRRLLLALGLAVPRAAVPVPRRRRGAGSSRPPARWAHRGGSRRPE